MLKFWSEIPAARTREIVADVATWTWVALWAVIGAQIHDDDLVVRRGGPRAAGRRREHPGRGRDARRRAAPTSRWSAPGSTTSRPACSTRPGDPFIYVGHELESMLILIARLLALLVVGLVLVPWLSRYLPWRAERLANVRAAHQAIRRAPVDLSSGAIQQALATRAINRLRYPELLEHTSDPFGDFAAGHYERLASAELASVGLR